MIFAPSPPENPTQRISLSYASKRSNYGVWSSSGETNSVYVPPMQSGQSHQKIKGDRQLTQVLKTLLLELPLLASSEEVTLSETTLRMSFALLRDFYLQIGSIAPNSPHLSFSFEGEVVMDWQRGEKQVVLYVSESGITQIRAWGSNIYEQMEEKQIYSIGEVVEAWNWITT